MLMQSGCNFATSNSNTIDMNTNPPPILRDTTPYAKWMTDTMGIIVYLLNSIASSLKKIVTRTGRPRLTYQGHEIIMLEDLAIGLNRTPRTLRNLRSEGKIAFYVSLDGRTIFLTQKELDEYIEKNYRLSTSDN